MRTIRVVVTCSDRKASPADPRHSVASLPPGPVEQRVATWVSRLTTASGRRVAAGDLYRGEHWSVVRRIATRADTEVWVASAGYGLVRFDSPLLPYQATFTTGGPDSVTQVDDARSPAQQAARWWRGLQSWAGPNGQRRSLDDLAGDGPLVIALSPPYLAALATDVEEAARASEQVALVSVGDASVRFDGLRLPGSAALRGVLGGSLQSLNARIVEHLLGAQPSTGLTRVWAHQHLARLVAGAPELPVFDRQHLTDDEVLEYVAEQLADDPTASCTRLHRQLRDSGRACEQARFRRLYLTARQELAR